MSAAHEVAARVAACRTKAEALLADVQALVGELPEWPAESDQSGRVHALAAVRAELEAAAGFLDSAVDYLSPRADDDDPDCCAHRRLQALLAAEEARPA